MLVEEKFSYIAKYLNGEMNSDEELNFKQWLEKEDSHKQLFEESLVLWDKTNYDPIPKSKLTWEHIAKEIKPVPKLLPKLLRAAMILILIGGALWIYQGYHAELAIQPEIFATNDTDTLHIHLRDNSKIILGPNSTLKVFYPWTEKRAMTFEGSGFFDVEKDSKRPFEVQTGKGKFQVLGTEFVIRTNDLKHNLLTVQEGLVRFINRKNKRVEVPKHFALKNENLVDASQLVELKSSDFYWMHKRLEYSNVSLRQVLQDLEKIYNINIQAASESILNCKFSGKFVDNKLAEVLEILAFALELNVVEKNKNQYLLKGEGCTK